MLRPDLTPEAATEAVLSICHLVSCGVDPHYIIANPPPPVLALFAEAPAGPEEERTYPVSWSCSKCGGGGSGRYPVFCADRKCPCAQPLNLPPENASVGSVGAGTEEPKGELSGSEALYGFVAWLTTRDRVASFGAGHDAARAADLVATFCAVNHLTEPRDTWTEWLTHPAPESEAPAPPPTGIPSVSPLPCPWCRGPTELFAGYVVCRTTGCLTCGPNAPTDAEAIAKWNQVAGLKVELEVVQRDRFNLIRLLDLIGGALGVEPALVYTDLGPSTHRAFPCDYPDKVVALRAELQAAKEAQRLPVGVIPWTMGFAYIGAGPPPTIYPDPDLVHWTLIYTYPGQEWTHPHLSLWVGEERARAG